MSNWQVIKKTLGEELAKSRIHRILLCSLAIGLAWVTVDYFTGNLEVNLVHDAICLGLGIVAERIVPWKRLTS